MSEHSKSNSVRALALVWLIWRDGPLTLPSGEVVRHACPIAFAFTEPHARELYEAEQELDPLGARGELHLGQADVWADEIEQAGMVRTILNAGVPVVESVIDDFEPAAKRQAARDALTVAQWHQRLRREGWTREMLSAEACTPTLRWGKVEKPDYWCPACALARLGELAHFTAQPGVLRELRGGGRYYRRIIARTAAEQARAAHHERMEYDPAIRPEELVAQQDGEIPPGQSGSIAAQVDRACTPLRVEVVSEPHEELTLAALRFGAIHIAGTQDDGPAAPVAWSVPEVGPGTHVTVVLVNHGTEAARVSVRVYA